MQKPSGFKKALGGETFFQKRISYQSDINACNLKFLKGVWGKLFTKSFPQFRVLLIATPYQIYGVLPYCEVFKD